PTDGTVAPVTSLLPGEVSQMWVQFLPDGKHFIYLARTSLTSNDPGAKIYAQSLDGGDPTLLLATQSRAIAVPDYLRSEEHTSELQSHRDLHSFPTRRSSDLSNDPGAKIYAQSLDGGDPTLLLATQSRAIAVPDYL